MKITDVALWDIGGKAAGLPIHKLLGGYRDRVPAYASSMVLPSSQAYAEEALAYRQAGWAAYEDPPADPLAPGHRGVPGGARRRRAGLHADARFDLELHLRARVDRASAPRSTSISSSATSWRC